ncbi:hypothetical protein BKA80DRAFT_280614 [Phyllosticta citrichinensis]
MHQSTNSHPLLHNFLCSSLSSCCFALPCFFLSSLTTTTSSLLAPFFPPPLIASRLGLLVCHTLLHWAFDVPSLAGLLLRLAPCLLVCFVASVVTIINDVLQQSDRQTCALAQQHYCNLRVYLSIYLPILVQKSGKSSFPTIPSLLSHNTFPLGALFLALSAQAAF